MSVTIGTLRAHPHRRSTHMTDSTTGTLIERDLETYLSKVGGDYVAAYNEIVADEERKALSKRPPNNAAIRRAAYAQAVKNLDPKQLRVMNRTFRNFVPLAKKNAEITSETGELTLQQAEDLMIEVLEVKRIQEMAKSRYEEIRKRVFNSLTETFASAGEPEPEYVAGHIDIPNLGLKFTREGGARKDPELDEATLRDLVGDEVWNKVTRVEVIPAQEVRTFDEGLFLAAARKNPALLEKLRQALVVGGHRPVSFHQRSLSPEELEAYRDKE
ncbi:hypothetical protein SEA_JPICKLES_191 [Mycobacterium phage JPickles]|uniref:Uncharacterized protein n=26 Tax=Bixzunavirus TaxID=680114 RepID=B5LJS6_9CAUD|nr:gp188 [Mycobacterium phage Rizal]YP_008060966.1 hypothetical protein M181_gp161 [Mycobacterium phage Gizmo]YP_009216419.1 hypothetical protein ALICE_182 [Mycobacterium phage Alice]YP_010058490.1 hypothetical protein KHO64_gp153 [Mycobacterium phage Quasimodo]AEJ94860.1 hypothetical protein GHOST_195 [Mycobacterium phage Ghost]AER25529.1 hypothetical protein WALLY_194 [Mycobacterium phage Wally]AIX12841.1 hypothetical protein PBI_ZYGOTAIGA_191 [Mycobacterium phage ZygoTaiga]AYD81921.1 hypo